MNVDTILQSFAKSKTKAILIGGMNFLLRHQPVLTFDVDLWVDDTDPNLYCLLEALRTLGAQWGRDESTWGPIPPEINWLKSQTVFCLTTHSGAVDIYREEWVGRRL